MADGAQSQKGKERENLLMVGKVAHDFNNLLTPLLAYPQLIRADLSEDSSSHELLDIIEKTARDMAHITTQLLVLATPISCDVEDVDINEQIEITVLSLRKSLKGRSEIQIEMELSGGIGSVRGNSDYIPKIVENVCMNGMQAMGLGDSENARGRLRVSTMESNEEGRQLATGEELSAGRYACVVVEDEGPGIDPGVRRSLLDPFVTTRKTSARRGAGLGLSIASKIMGEHGGYIDFDSSDGKGARVVLMFPLQGKGTEVEPANADVSKPSRENGESGGKVLVVDDEETILRLFKMMIATGIPGCEVDVAGNGAVAVERFEAGRHSVIIMDLHMPVMDGQAAFFQIQKLCNDNGWDMPAVVFCTGFLASETLRQKIDGDGRHCIFSKPVRTDLLLGAVKERLDRSPN